MTRQSALSSRRTPLLSIIIPCYNQGHFLLHCLNSIREQHFQSWEAIIVNDASPDSELIHEIVHSLRDTRIRIVDHSENRGLAASRNTGIRAAQSQIIMLVDSDDAVMNNFGGIAIDLFFNCPELDVVIASFELFGDWGRKIDRRRGQKTSLDIAIWTWVPGPGVVYRKRIWEEVGGYCEEAMLRLGMEDRDFWLRAIPKKLSIIQLVLATYALRRGIASMSTKMEPARFKLHSYIAARQKDILKELGVYRTFIVEGYVRSASYHFGRSNRLSAILLTLRGLRYDPTNRKLHRLLMKYVLPRSIGNILQQFRRVRL